MSLNSGRPTSPSSSSSLPRKSLVTAAGRDIDPLLEDLSEAKQRFRRNVVSMAAELKEVRSRLALTEQSYVQETLTRQASEAKARALEEEIDKLQKSLEERNGLINASTSAAEKYLEELDELRYQLTATKATVDASVASAQSAQLQCFSLLKELDEKNHSLKEHEARVQRLAEQLDNLQNELQAREFSQKQLKDEVVRVEHDIMEAIAKTGVNKDSELRKVLDEVSPMNLETMNQLLTTKDEEIVNLKDEMRILSATLKEIESQFEKHRRADQDLKKRVLKLEFSLQESRSQTRKLQRIGERRDKVIKELKDQLSAKQAAPVENAKKENFWESSNFKVLLSMSLLILVVFSKR
ncbi:hypothetical protein Dimus_012031 [Dionaea muscipula]